MRRCISVCSVAVVIFYGPTNTPPGCRRFSIPIALWSPAPPSPQFSCASFLLELELILFVAVITVSKMKLCLLTGQMKVYVPLFLFASTIPGSMNMLAKILSHVTLFPGLSFYVFYQVIGCFALWASISFWKRFFCCYFCIRFIWVRSELGGRVGPQSEHARNYSFERISDATNWNLKFSFLQILLSMNKYFHSINYIKLKRKSIWNSNPSIIST
jgi:hypothetical protein